MSFCSEKSEYETAYICKVPTKDRKDRDGGQREGSKRGKGKVATSVIIRVYTVVYRGSWFTMREKYRAAHVNARGLLADADRTQERRSSARCHSR